MSPGDRQRHLHRPAHIVSGQGRDFTAVVQIWGRHDITKARQVMSGFQNEFVDAEYLREKNDPGRRFPPSFAKVSVIGTDTSRWSTSIRETSTDEIVGTSV